MVSITAQQEESSSLLNLGKTILLYPDFPVYRVTSLVPVAGKAAMMMVQIPQTRKAAETTVLVVENVLSMICGVFLDRSKAKMDTASAIGDA